MNFKYIKSLYTFWKLVNFLKFDVYFKYSLFPLIFGENFNQGFNFFLSLIRNIKSLSKIQTLIILSKNGFKKNVRNVEIFNIFSQM